MRTPAVDAFMQESLLFTQFHVSPTCSPCRAALMSGRNEFKNGVTHTILERERMNLKTYTLPQMLKSVVYTTGIFGKWHLGDEQVYRPESRGKIATSQIDKLAAQGMIFTDTHSSSSVYTPTRYGVMTGRYNNWRTRLQAGVLQGYSEPLIAADRLTVPALLKQQGYTTACIGKLHLGMGIEKGITLSTDLSPSGKANGNWNSAQTLAAGATPSPAARKRGACPTLNSVTSARTSPKRKTCRPNNPNQSRG